MIFKISLLSIWIHTKQYVVHILWEADLHDCLHVHWLHSKFRGREFTFACFHRRFHFSLSSSLLSCSPLFFNFLSRIIPSSPPLSFLSSFFLSPSFLSPSFLSLSLFLISFTSSFPSSRHRFIFFFSLSLFRTLCHLLFCHLFGQLRHWYRLVNHSLTTELAFSRSRPLPIYLLERSRSELPLSCRARAAAAARSESPFLPDAIRMLLSPSDAPELPLPPVPDAPSPRAIQLVSVKRLLCSSAFASSLSSLPSFNPVVESAVASFLAININALLSLESTEPICLAIFSIAFGPRMAVHQGVWAWQRHTPFGVAIPSIRDAIKRKNVGHSVNWLPVARGTRLRLNFHIGIRSEAPDSTQRPRFYHTTPPLMPDFLSTGLTGPQRQRHQKQGTPLAACRFASSWLLAVDFASISAFILLPSFFTAPQTFPSTSFPFLWKPLWR